ncbi:MAG: isoprenylcysteine carboxylmethyltransferase family protein [Halanaerobium sp.]|nr:isoprenylcysteine carboxylmethyltransferase family protein [Halanaerobium sp.]
MNAFLLAVPIILIRYPILSLISKEAMGRAAFFPPTQGKEKAAFYVYQFTSLFLLCYLFFKNIKLSSSVNYLGLAIFFLGTVLYTKSTIDFARPGTDGINTKGLYKYSRNPMYVAFFLYFLGCGMLINSWLYLAVLLIFQVAVHYLILSEERWCWAQFGKEYQQYSANVRRYL